MLTATASLSSDRTTGDQRSAVAGPFIHYSRNPLSKVHASKQIDGRAADGDKPNGLWFSAGDGEDGWRSWCESEEYGLSSLVHATEIVFKSKARIRSVSGAEAIDAFNAEYGCQPPWARGLSFNHRAIDWAAVAKKYDAIVIAPYCWDRRISEIRWYYGWGCASGCVWNASAIAELRVMAQPTDARVTALTPATTTEGA